MAIQFSPKLLAVALSASLLAACGGGSSDSNSQSTGQSISNGGSVAGKVIDGYVFGASVCFDSNSDSACTVSETIARSNTTGGYGLLNSSTGNLLASGGVNLDTNRNNSLTLRTINLVDGPTVRQLTPLTTLLVSIVGNSQNLNTINEAKNLINAKFALGNFDFITLDPIELSNTVAAGESLRNQALNAHKKGVQIANIIMSAQQATGGTNNLAVNDRVYATLKLLLQANMVDLTNADNISALIQGATGQAASTALVTLTQSSNTATASATDAAAVGSAQKAHSDALLAANIGESVTEDGTNNTGGTGGSIDPIDGNNDESTPNPTTPPAQPVSAVQPLFDGLCLLPVLGDLLVTIAQFGDPTIADCGEPSIPGFSGLPGDGTFPDFGGQFANVQEACSAGDIAACAEAFTALFPAIPGAGDSGENAPAFTFPSFDDFSFPSFMDFFNPETGTGSTTPPGNDAFANIQAACAIDGFDFAACGGAFVEAFTGFFTGLFNQAA